MRSATGVTSRARGRMVRMGLAIAVAFALTLSAAPGHAGRGGGSVRGANIAAARPSAPPAAAQARQNTASPVDASRSTGQAVGQGQIRPGAAASAGAVRDASASYAAYGARGAYGTNGAARIQTGQAAAGVNRSAVAVRASRGPVWATTLPAGASGANHFGRPYYRYANRYYRPYYYGGIPYYGYVWPPYDSTYEEPPVGAITLGAGDESLLYSDGSYYEQTYDEGGTQYQVVPAPTGLRLPPGSLPAEFATVTVGGRAFVFYGNTFYERVADPAGDVLVVVAEPPGVVLLKELPANFEPLPVGELTYFRSGGRHYVSYLDAQGAELFLGVDPPGAAAGTAQAAPHTPAPPAAEVVTMVVRAGTVTTVRVAAEIDCAQVRPGDFFEGALAEDLVADGRLVAPRGSRAYGKVVAATAGEVPGSAALGLALTDLTIGGRVVAASSKVTRFGAGGAPVPKAGAEAALQSGLAAAVDSGSAAAKGGQGERLALAPGTAVEFRLASTLIVGVAAN